MLKDSVVGACRIKHNVEDEDGMPSYMQITYGNINGGSTYYWRSDDAGETWVSDDDAAVHFRD